MHMEKLLIFTLYYKLKNGRIDSPEFTVQNELFGTAKITKNADTF